jgi:FkbM family methyltransferase
MHWFQPGLSKLIAAYPFSTGRWRLRSLAAQWLVAPIGLDTYIRVTGIVDAEWTLLDGLAKEDRTVAWLRKFLRPGMTVVDVGANIGYICLTAARLVGDEGRVLSFEPTPAVAQRLRENILLNGFSQVTVVEAAVSSAPGTLRFYKSEDDPEANTLFSNHDNFITVPGVTLDDTLGQIGMSRVDLLKVDAEGAELDVFRGASGLLSSSNPPCILFEANPITLAAAGSSVNELLALISSYGYTCAELERFLWQGVSVINYLATHSRTRA